MRFLAIVISFVSLALARPISMKEAYDQAAPSHCESTTSWDDSVISTENRYETIENRLRQMNRSRFCTERIQAFSFHERHHMTKAGCLTIVEEHCSEYDEIQDLYECVDRYVKRHRFAVNEPSPTDSFSENPDMEPAEQEGSKLEGEEWNTDH
ncbi:hypothetical protein XA68_13603 [Ophiocordyceps unilateralis]|uniref:Uncharacterized protein n=1 Tax=Ophiocordyceps unilateralis TaxID=268505 RepID=A0A2A9PAF4_OPHUN|nr:hypothetical protein XA68_13603 [Ophiocordyceps unilateralis]